MREFDWPIATMGLVLSAFGWGFVLAQLGTAWLTDRWGGLKVLVLAMAGWSLATIFMALPKTPLHMGVFRGLVGAFESAYVPAVAAFIVARFQKRDVGRIYGVCLSSTSMGAVIAVPVATYVLSSQGWRMVFYLFGTVGLVWAATMYLYGSSDRPSKTKPGPTLNSRTIESVIPFRKLVQRQAVWGLALTYLPNTFTYYFVANWMPTYLNRARGFSLKQSGLYTTLPFFCAFLASNIVGWIVSRLEGKGWSRSLAGKAIFYVGFPGVALLLLVAGYTASPLIAVTTMSLTMGLVGGNSTSFGIIATDIAPLQVGVVTGFITFVGAVGALLAPTVTGFLVNATGRWEHALYLTAAINVLALLGVLTFISRNNWVKTTLPL